MSGTLGDGSPFNTLVIDDSDSSVGFWANAGLLFRATDHFNLGVDVRYSDADVSLAPVGDPDLADLEAGGTHYGVTLGYHW